jgi:hypothetical protein
MKQFIVAIWCLLLSTAAHAAVIPEAEVIKFLKYDLNFPRPELALAIIRVESACNSKANVYDGGCKCHTYGMMQLQLGTARSMGFTWTARQLLDWQTNITYGTKYLLAKLEENNGDVPSAISAYNAGTALIKWSRSTSIRRFVNHQYVRDVLAELGAIVMDAELMRIINPSVYFDDAPTLIPSTS